MKYSTVPFKKVLDKSLRFLWSISIDPCTYLNVYYTTFPKFYICCRVFLPWCMFWIDLAGKKGICRKKPTLFKVAHLAQRQCLFPVPHLSKSLFSLDGRSRILGWNPDKSLKSFSSLLFRVTATALHWDSFSSNSHNLLQFLLCATVHCEGERRKTDIKPHPLPYGLRNPCRNLKSENSQDAQNPQINYVHEFDFRQELSNVHSSW